MESQGLRLDSAEVEVPLPSSEGVMDIRMG